MSYSDQPPPPPYGGQPGGYGGYGGAGGPVDHPRGTVVLILGILGLVCCGVLAPIAWVMGNTALKEIDANPQAYTNRGTVRAGQICASEVCAA